MSETIEQSAKRAWIEVATLREQVEKLKAELASIDGDLNDPRANLTLTTSEIIWELKEQVEKLTKERDALRSRRCEVCGYLEHEREHTGCLREQLAALAEQNEKMRAFLNFAWKDIPMSEYAFEILEHAMNLPDLASPVLNRIRADAKAEENEACAKVCSEYSDKKWRAYKGVEGDASDRASDFVQGESSGSEDCAEAIRARRK